MAIRRAKSTSMGIAIDMVKQGRAAAAVSSGNTGALMAMAKLSLRTMPGIDRPALAGRMPTLGENDTVVLDLGANTECDARNLVQFAVMGAAYARTTMELASPASRCSTSAPKTRRAPRSSAMRHRHSGLRRICR